MYVCIYIVCIYESMYICLSMYGHVYVYVYVYVFICMYICIHVCKFFYECIFILFYVFYVLYIMRVCVCVGRGEGSVGG